MSSQRKTADAVSHGEPDGVMSDSNCTQDGSMRTGREDVDVAGTIRARDAVGTAVGEPHIPLGVARRPAIPSSTGTRKLFSFPFAEIRSMRSVDVAAAYIAPFPALTMSSTFISPHSTNDVVR